MRRGRLAEIPRTSILKERCVSEPPAVAADGTGPGFEGATTASGAAFDPNGFTAAHPTLPFGTRLLVTYGGEQVVVTVTDRGPFVGGRGLDLSQAAAEEIGLTAAGSDVVDVQVLGY